MEKLMKINDNITNVCYNITHTHTNKSTMNRHLTSSYSSTKIRKKVALVCLSKSNRKKNIKKKSFLFSAIAIELTQVKHEKRKQYERIAASSSNKRTNTNFTLAKRHQHSTFKDIYTLHYHAQQQNSFLLYNTVTVTLNRIRGSGAQISYYFSSIFEARKKNNRKIKLFDFYFPLLLLTICTSIVFSIQVFLSIECSPTHPNQ